ncbi:MAG TPA: YlbF family regulator [Clostridiales bacterium]|nr:YlbF family regulator [Clostridiales bacterium]
MYLEKAKALGQAICESIAYQQYKQALYELSQSVANKAVFEEYVSLRQRLQMAALTNTEADENDVRRFGALSEYFLKDEQFSRLITSEMTLRSMIGEAMQTVSDMTGIIFGE